MTLDLFQSNGPLKFICPQISLIFKVGSHRGQFLALCYSSHVNTERNTQTGSYGDWEMKMVMEKSWNLKYCQKKMEICDES